MLVAFVAVAFAQNNFNITYPVSELDNCESQSACKVYCDKPANHGACRAFVEAKGLVKKTEERPHVDTEKRGPGGCDSETMCRVYCDDPAHTEECVEFAEREGYMTKQEAKQARDLINKRGGTFEGPGGCKEVNECRAYCAMDEHFDECMNFAEKDGLMTSEEVARARKFRNKTGPGGCKGEACKTYCDEPGNEDECLAFAEREGLIPKEELERARKFMKASQTGGPGGCKGRECENYCNTIEHRDECFEFAKKNNLMSEEELAHIERGRTLETKVREAGGPGGCRDEKACMEYCHRPENVEECLGFATAHGGMSREEAKKMMEQFVEGQDNTHAPKRIGDGTSNRDEIEKRFERMREFEQMEREFRGKAGEFDKPSEFPPQGRQFRGPGGCASPQECMDYCRAHKEECGYGSGSQSNLFEGSPPTGALRPEGQSSDPATRPNGLRRPDMHQPGSQEGSKPPQDFEQHYRQEFQRQYQEQYDQQYKQEQPSGSFGEHVAPVNRGEPMFTEPAPMQEAPSEPTHTEPAPVTAPTTLNNITEAFANIIFAPVFLIEVLFR